MNEKDKRYYPRTLLRFEVQVAEHCNLNCRNCMHYAALAEPEFLDIKQYEQDISHLAELFDGEVEWIRLMGGEPLLHNELNRIMKMTRAYFPIGHIYLVTNGILLPEMTEEFWKTCRECNIEIAPTKYPIVLDYEKLRDESRKHGVKYKLYTGDNRRPTMWRFPIDVRGDFDPVSNFYDCKCANGCLTLRNGKMYTCAPSAHAHHLKKYFNLDIAISKRNGVSIYDVKDAKELMENLVKPLPFCRYCDYKNMEDYEDDWAVSKRDRYEWISFTFSDEDLEYLKNFSSVYIYGAGKWGLETYQRLRNAEVEVQAFIVTNADNNFREINGIPVLVINEVDKLQKDSVCILAFNGNGKSDVQHKIREKGCNNIIPIMHM